MLRGVGQTEFSVRSVWPAHPHACIGIGQDHSGRIIEARFVFISISPPPASRMKAPMCDEHPHFGKVISRPFPGWLECLADSGPSGLEGDEVARRRRHRVTRPFVGRRGANVRGPAPSADCSDARQPCPCMSDTDILLGTGVPIPAERFGPTRSRLRPSVMFKSSHPTK
jgi:hypothetical protein